MVTTKTSRARKPTVAKKTTARAPAKLPRAVMGAVNAAREKQAIDLVVLDLRKAGGFTDYFIDVLPGASTVVNWTVLGPPFSEGTVGGPSCRASASA